MRKRQYQEASLRKLFSWVAISTAMAIFVWQGYDISGQQDAAKQAGIEKLEAEVDRDMQLLRAQLIIMSAPPAIIMCDAENHLIAISNPAAEKLFGYDHKEMIGKDISILMPAEIAARHVKLFAAAAEDARDHSGNYMTRRTNVCVHGLHKDGHLIPLVLSIRVIKYGDKVEFITSMTQQPADARPPPQKTERMKLPNIKQRQQQAQRAFKGVDR